MRMSVEREAGMDEATGFPKKYAIAKIFLVDISLFLYLHCVDRKYFFQFWKKGVFYGKPCILKCKKSYYDF